VTVGPKAASNIAMAIYELATNAAKYGALSTELGTVSIDWSDEATFLRLTWHEHDGPPVAPPARTGFGSLLVSQALFHAPNKSQLTFEPDGVRWLLVLEDAT
jgi:two-component sensor histidine kinase